jgi:hypothetical protein
MLIEAICEYVFSNVSVIDFAYFPSHHFSQWTAHSEQMAHHFHLHDMSKPCYFDSSSLKIWVHAHHRHQYFPYFELQGFLLFKETSFLLFLPLHVILNRIFQQSVRLVACYYLKQQHYL